MAGLISDAIAKANRDGPRSVLTEGLPWLYSRYRRRVADWYGRTFTRRYLRVRYETVSDADRYTYIDPRDVEFYLLQSQHTFNFCDVSLDVPLHEMEKGRFPPSLFTGIVLPGDWDQYRKPYEFDRVYSGLSHHYEGETPLAETEYMYQYALREKVRDDDTYLQRKIQQKKRLYESIRERGFLTQYELGRKATGTPVSTRPWGVTVNIGRDGELIFNNSAHTRLAISRLLRLDEIPVLVVVRHREWHAIREEIRGANTESELSNRAKGHLDHPDVQEFVSENWQ